MPEPAIHVRRAKTPGPHSAWYRSLYWRLAAGLVALLALMLAAEGALFLWMTDRITATMPSGSPRRLAVLVASDVSSALSRDPSLDLDAYVRDQYDDILRSFVVVMRDGRVAANHDDVPADVLAALRLDAELRGGGGGRGRRAPARAAGRGAGGLRGEVAPILVDGVLAGRVSVLPGNPPFSRVLRRLGPTMGLVAGAMLGVGTAVIALFVFGPARRRLKAVQSATERLGSGDLTARAPDHGGDEVAAVARSFNRMADELASRARALESSDKARRQLLADVSHELMTPLTAMRGYIETLTMAELQLDVATRQRYMQIVTDETHRLEQIIGDLLDLARLEGGGPTLRREHVDVAALFDRVAERHERETRARQIRLVQQVAPGAAFVPGDPDRLEQALQNLAANALRHTPEGGTITLTAESSADGVRLQVRDSGPGIPPEHLPLIFDRFYKADAARAAAGGSGLGLSIVKAIVERHRGTITAHNDAGAVFSITLPASAP